MQLGGHLPPEKRIRKAIVDLCDSQPFYGSVAMHVEIRAAGDIVPTAGVLPEGVLLYNPDFVADLEEARLRGLVAHEVLHLVLDFGPRREARDLQTWNTAQDVCINHMVLADGFDLPPGGVIPEDGQFEVGPLVVEDVGSKTSEAVYDELAEADAAVDDLSGPNRRAIEQSESEPEGDETGSSAALADRNPGGFDVHLGDPEHLDEEDIVGTAAEPVEGRDWDEIAVEAAQQARRVAAERGTAPAGVLERVRASTSETVDWRSLLREQVAGSLPSGYTWRRPADKSRAADTYLPATESRRLAAVVALDTSGSMDTDALGRALGELHALEREYDELDLTLLQHDAAVQRVTREWRPSTAVEFEAEGRGGTSHRPVFEWLARERPDADLLVAVTDGLTDLPESMPPGLDVVWVLVGERVREPDRGVAVRVSGCRVRGPVRLRR